IDPIRDTVSFRLRIHWTTYRAPHDEDTANARAHRRLQHHENAHDEVIGE
ncbi:hypothetical protein Hypma_004138, partial [Hypsizygus marmoreus]